VVYIRVKAQIAKLRKSSKLSRVKREMQMGAVKREFLVLMSKFTNKYKRVPKDELFDIIENSVRELKVSDVMEA